MSQELITMLRKQAEIKYKRQANHPMGDLLKNAADDIEKQRSLVLQLTLNTMYALDALNFEPGNWNDPERHLREQIQLAKQHLSNTDAMPEKTFTVIAGKHDDDYDNGRNVKYASNPYTTLEAALDDYRAHESYPFCYIEFDGYLLIATEDNP